MLLSYLELCDLVHDGVIDADIKNVNGASIDIRLGHELLIESPTLPVVETLEGNELRREYNLDSIIDLSLKSPPNSSLVPMTKFQMGDDGYVLAPGQFCLAHSVETFNLPNTIASLFLLQSSIARAGLNALLAGWCDPGWHGAQLTLELHNTLQYHSLLLKPGLRIGQMVFYTCRMVPQDR